MGTHPLGGSASITIEKVTATFAPQQPTIEPGREGNLLKFTEPEGRNNTADIRFVFKANNITGRFAFGIKQFIQGMIYRYTYKGNKDIDGRISESYWTGSTWMLDCSTRSLTVLFDKDDVTTGAQGSAPQAPFYSDGPAFVRNGAAIELSIIDMPGGAHPLELRNGSTNRVNYLQSVRRVERFLTVLTAVLPDGSHLPLEAVNWQHRIEGEVAWNEQGKPDVTKIVQECKGLGRFPEVPLCRLRAPHEQGPDGRGLYRSKAKRCSLRRPGSAPKAGFRPSNAQRDQARGARLRSRPISNLDRPMMRSAFVPPSHRRTAARSSRRADMLSRRHAQSIATQPGRKRLPDELEGEGR